MHWRRWRAEALDRARHKPEAARRRQEWIAGQRSSTRWRRSSTRSAAASPATASGRRSTCYRRQIDLTPPRGADRHAGLRLDVPAGVEHPHAHGSATRRQRVVDFADHNLHVLELQRAGAAPHAARRAQAASPHAARPAGPHPLPHLLLRGAAGASACATASSLRLHDGIYEVVHRFRALERRPSDLRRVSASPGETEREFLLSAHICHPSLANDNCSGLAVLTTLARDLARRADRATATASSSRRAPSARWPGCRQRGRASTASTTGSSSSCVGDGGGPTYKRSRRGNADDRPGDGAWCCGTRPAARQRADFSPYGYDERQYCSPGFNLPVGPVPAQRLRAPSPSTIPRRTIWTSSGPSIWPARYDMIMEVDRHRRGQLDAAQPVPEGRAAARPARPLLGDRRQQVDRGRHHGAPLGAEPGRRQPLAARHRRTLRPELRPARRRRGQVARRSRAAAPFAEASR